MGRGNHQQDIFEDKTDYQYFLILLEEIQKRYPFELHGYCLMTNHYHLLIETREKEIWFIMKRLAQLYTYYYNNKYGMTGHLFQGRYRSCIIRDDIYFLQTSRYIHLNPVKAGMVPSPENYQWSSYRTIIGLSHSALVATEKTLLYFIDNERIRYRAFVEDAKTFHTYEIDIQKSMGEDDLWLPG